MLTVGDRVPQFNLKAVVSTQSGHEFADIDHETYADRWRVLHRFVVIFYILALWHALILGLDLSHYPWARPMIWLAQLPLVVLLLSRLHDAGTIGRRGMIALSTAVVVAVGLLVATGNSDFIHTV